MRCLVGFVLVLALVASPMRASAQVGEEGGSSAEPSRSEVAADPAKSASEPALKLGLDSDDLEVTPIELPLPRECKPGYMAGPAVGIAVGTLASLTGPGMIWAGNFELEGGTSEETRADRGLKIGGTVLLLAGLGTLIYSGVKLSKNRHERRRVCH